MHLEQILVRFRYDMVDCILLTAFLYSFYAFLLLQLGALHH